FQEALAIQLATLGDKHLATAATYNDLAAALVRLLQLHQALEYFQKSLDIKCSSLGDRHPECATTFSNMAVVLERQGRLDEAL
ncbi:tetratricopeptide repeat protein, partial [Klebsiella pneumoniae]|uniref:tetratricopeptide repeat protein n=1 Tax=Klebsiella pneumoniae TaxID=573 RepID=UPI0040456FF0